MTPTERRAALVEKMAKAMCSDGEPCGCTPACKTGTHYAILAITVALEEAAQVADEYAEIDTCGPCAGWDIAAVIRALIPEGGR